ncbi:MAG: ribosome small subunit-dependent GTPase A [Clostridia bacterium]|nr:ribosome small subunit-dependent GTPase A [Clostridia bacterium]
MADRIIKGIGGFYYVQTADGLIECKARGSFRQKKMKPYVGDYVKISIHENAENTIDEIMDRKNVLIRPPVANIDQLVIVSGMVTPAPNMFVIDKLCAVCEIKHIEPIIIFNKTDLKDGSHLADIYTHAGFTSFCVSAKTGDGVETLGKLLEGKTTVFTGNSGAGKSSLLNCLDASLNLQTGEVSEKLGRGRHTTRMCEIFSLCGGEVVDTPGFSSLEISKLHTLLKEDLPYCFREFEPYLTQCTFTSCAHIKEKGCAIKSALEAGDIESSRYESYCMLYEQLKDVKDWEVQNTIK